jgi:hypothetical protein
MQEDDPFRDTAYRVSAQNVPRTASPAMYDPSEELERELAGKPMEG